MEMLIEGFDDETKQKYKDDGGMYLDVCKWSRIKCDDDQGVIQVEIHSANVSGSVKLCYIPPKMKVLRISSFGNSKLTGSIDLIYLPHGMQVIDVQGNHLNAIAVVDSRTDATIKLKGSGVTSVVGENGRELDMNRFLK